MVVRRHKVCAGRKVRPVKITVKGHTLRGRLSPKGRVTLTAAGRKTYNRLKKKCLAKKQKRAFAYRGKRKRRVKRAFKKTGIFSMY